MCGIYCRISAQNPGPLDLEVERLLKQRGPDHYGYEQEECLREADPSGADTVCVTLAASVLGLRRENDELPVQQPLELSNHDGYLCWNGEAWKYDGNIITGADTKFVATMLSEVSPGVADFHERTLDVLQKIRGPFAFVYYNRPKKVLFYGRDCVGRRSLLWTITDDDSFHLSSVAVGAVSANWQEVEADGIYSFDLASLSCGTKLDDCITSIPYHVTTTDEHRYMAVPWSPMNMAIPTSGVSLPSATESPTRLRTSSPAVSSLFEVLAGSVQLRVSKYCSPERSASIAILFSGGLDCTLLARLAHECLPERISIDLVNVAFENPRIHKVINDEISAYETCPDRITARQSLAELQQICPRRQFHLICVDVPYAESTKYRNEIRALISPHDTEMDISIAMALFFAARGPTCSEILISGLGADELFGGYQRHALAYRRGGYTALLEELQLDTERLGKRNLGRDDRVISRWGKEARYPFLDEDVIAWAMDAPIWEKVGFGVAARDVPQDGDKDVKLDDKLILRCMAKKYGMSGVAEEKKRAIQFGSRSAKMESGRTKGTEKVS